MEQVQYDYEGLSNTVIAERRGPYLKDASNPEQPLLYYVGDRFVSTYTYGPLGLISRTAEMDDNEVSNNRVHYYLPDAQGGHVGMLLDDDGDPTTPGQAAFQTYDAFGNAMSKTFTAAGSFAWRGAEGGVTDREPRSVGGSAAFMGPSGQQVVELPYVASAKNGVLEHCSRAVAHGRTP